MRPRALRITLLSRQPEPLGGFDIVLGDTLAFGVHNAQGELRLRRTLLVPVPLAAST